MACVACHKAKVKCDKRRPCSRCVRLGRECIPHVSRQGQRKKRKHDDDEEELTGSAHVNAISNSVRCRRNHFGLQYLIRSWMSFAFRRRSISLLSHASNVAVRCGISMDEVFNESERQRGMDFLYPILLVPQREQEVTGDALRYEELPPRMLEQMNCASDHFSEESSRWIWVREMNKGISRYWLSPAFVRDVASYEEIRSTYRANEKAIIDILLPSAEERSKHTKAFAQQISHYAKTDTPPRSCGFAGLGLQTKHHGIIQVDQIACLEIVSVDQAFYQVEYVRVPKATNNAVSVDFRYNVDLDNSSDDLDFGFVLDLLK